MFIMLKQVLNLGFSGLSLDFRQLTETYIVHKRNLRPGCWAQESKAYKIALITISRNLFKRRKNHLGFKKPTTKDEWRILSTSQQGQEIELGSIFYLVKPQIRQSLSKSQ